LRDKRPSDEWEESAGTYDAWYERFEGAVDHAVDLEILRRHLPRDRSLRILDAAGGTGRISFPLSHRGHRITLCDISPAMLAVARGKVARTQTPHPVRILQCDVNDLPFPDGSFDAVICWDGGGDFVGELARVVCEGAVVSAFFDNAKIASPAEAERAFEGAGLEPLGTYGVCGWSEVLQLPEPIRESREWDPDLFARMVDMVLLLSREPAAQGKTRHLVVYGRKA